VITNFARRRSCLSVPGSSEKMLTKALGLPADELVLDLEDAVAPPDKAEAQARVTALLAAPSWQDRTVAVRINAIGTPWHEQDVSNIVAARHPRLTIVMPKVESPRDMQTVSDLIGRLEGASDVQVGLQALVETARGLANVQAIAAASPRLRSLILGYADLASSLGRRAGSDLSWRSAQDAVLLAARANDLQAIDGPYLQVQAGERLRVDAELVRDLGYDGKWVIHPSHIEIVNAAFTPSADEISRARAVIGTLDAGVGAVAFDGQMTDEAMRAGALRTLALAGLDQ
jgi:citrate lyase subunit beta / citryl-CoA lyase